MYNPSVIDTTKLMLLSLYTSSVHYCHAFLLFTHLYCSPITAVFAYKDVWAKDLCVDKHLNWIYCLVQYSSNNNDVMFI